MATNLNTISQILKEQYLPVLKNGISSEPSPFLEMVKKVPLTSGEKITAIAPYGINGGFGFGSDGDATPVAGTRDYKRFEVAPVNMYVDVRISDKTVKLASDSGALLDALDDEVSSSYEAAKWNVGRALFGDGSGVLCTIVDQPYGDTPNNLSYIAADNVNSFVEGLAVDVYVYPSSSTIAPTLPAENKAMRVRSINRETNLVILEGICADCIRSDKAGNYGFIVVQGSYNKELTGLKAIFDDNINKLYGYEKTTNEFIRPLSVDALETGISDQVIYDAVKKAYDYRHSKIDLVMMGDDAFKAYQNYVREHNLVFCDKTTFVGGASGYKVMVGNRTVTVINEKLVPSKEAWCVDTSAFIFAHLDFDFCDYGSSGIFQLVPGTSYYRALLASYGNLVCKNPGGCVKIVNCCA